ncbi:peptidase M14 [Shewanella sp. AS1]|uniref:M14 family zinc carboxypeptidase n=1 Tax=Shewanella sp. AS1 TaxID=2907626 RepID=UPI001F2C85F8|nr:M14 family zinc carboxypeptidase [Shewanella sp. AS1]MCE9679728.1 peptidase M14 [Shewanella sp. AS1]
MTQVSPEKIANAKLDSPSLFFGHPLGQWHLRHDQINAYLNYLANHSPRVSIELSGNSYEARQQLTLVITSEKNQVRLDEILSERAQVRSGTKQQGTLIIWLTYSVHGDEASPAHSALEVSHQLSSSEEPWIKALLAEAVVLITPVQNPDGFDRFANWVNSYGDQHKVKDPNHNEHKPNWPSGRTNHYLADLNRDWLFLRHVETQGRIALFYRWHPHYVGDFHEMNHNKSYFFQPGVAARTHPLTPAKNQQLTAQLATFYAKALDGLKQPYFTGQQFDDFYYGKGSTYPDINGAIGVLFEQAGVTGQRLETTNGLLTFGQAIDNHIATSIASLKGAFALRQALKSYQEGFYSEQDKQTPSGRQRGMLVSTPGDTARRDDLAWLLTQHQIHYFYLPKAMRLNNGWYKAEESLFIPHNQPQKQLFEALFDSRTQFKDATFYDVSSWNLSHVYHLQMTPNISLDVDKLANQAPAFTEAEIAADTTAILVDWRDQQAAPLLQRLLSAKVRVKFAAAPLTVKIGAQANESPPLSESKEFAPGTLVIPLGSQDLPESELIVLITELANRHRIRLYSVNSSMAIEGLDLGSSDLHTIVPIKPLLVTGFSTSATEVGEIRYFMDRYLGVPLTQVDINRLPNIELGQYSHLLLADGSYSALDTQYGRKLAAYMNQGGIIIAQKGALNWLDRANLLDAELQDHHFFDSFFSAQGLAFADKDKLKAKKAIGGAIVSVDLDPTHPIAFGIHDSRLALLKNRALALGEQQAFSVAARYSQPLLVDGYLAEEYQQKLAKMTAISVERHGKGAIVALSDDLLFRNIWLDAQRIYSNSLYFIPALH